MNDIAGFYDLLSAKGLLDSEEASDEELARIGTATSNVKTPLLRGIAAIANLLTERSDAHSVRSEADQNPDTSSVMDGEDF